MTTAVRAPNPLWNIFSRDGRFAVDGEIHTYRSLDKTQRKPTFSDPAGINANPNPMRLNSLGESGPNVYWDTDEKYYVQIRCNDGTEYTFDNFPDSTGGGGSTTIGIDYDNKLQNGQFRFYYGEEIEPKDESIEIADYWQFNKSNVSAVDKIQFKRFNLGQSNPEATPIYYFRYLCTGAGTGEAFKDLFQEMADVRIFEQTELTFSFDAYSDVPRTIEVIFLQHFGDGVGASANVSTNVGSITLNPGVWEKQHVTFTPPSVAGKTIGTEGGDYSAILIRFPLDSVCDINLTNMYLLEGDKALPYPRLTKEQEDSNLLGSKVPDIGPNDHGKAIIAAKNRRYNLMFPVLPSMMMPYFGDTVPLGYEDEWALAQGQTVSRTETDLRYRRLFFVLGHKYGHGDDAWVARYTGANIGIAYTIAQAISIPINGAISPGFTYSQFAAGNQSHAYFDISCKGSAAQLDIYCREVGYAPALQDNGALNGNTTVFSGNARRRAVFVATFKAASAMSAGSYFLISTPAAGFAVYYTKDGAGSAPAISGFTNLNVAINGSDSAHDVMLKTMSVLAGYQVDYIECKPASSIPSGSYITINTLNRGIYYFWFRIGGNGTDPKPAGKIGVLVDLLSGDTATQVAQKLGDVIDWEFYKIPDMRAMIIKGIDPNGINDFDFRIGGNVPGSVQYDQVNEHTHNFDLPYKSEPPHAGIEPHLEYNLEPLIIDHNIYTVTPNRDINSGGSLYAGQGGYETRPTNMGANYLIKL